MVHQASQLDTHGRITSGQKIRRSKKNLKCAQKVKFRHMLAYQMKLGYELALAPGDDASSNPGFESVLGVFSSGQ